MQCFFGRFSEVESFGQFNISCQIRFPNQLVSFFNLGTNTRLIPLLQSTPYLWWIKSKYCTIFYDFGFPKMIKFTLLVFFGVDFILKSMTWSFITILSNKIVTNFIFPKIIWDVKFIKSTISKSIKKNQGE
jgi:hypothetical protein